MARKKHKLDFDSRGGVIVISRTMTEHPAYETMPCTAKVLMILLQTHWDNYKPVAYGVREAAVKLGCNFKTSIKAFNILQERGFIVCDSPSLFNSRSGSKAREWRLSWMPFNDKKPTHDWEKWQA